MCFVVWFMMVVHSDGGGDGAGGAGGGAGGCRDCGVACGDGLW